MGVDRTSVTGGSFRGYDLRTDGALRGSFDINSAYTLAGFSSTPGFTTDGGSDSRIFRCPMSDGRIGDGDGSASIIPCPVWRHPGAKHQGWYAGDSYS